jgi:hypothetical protein
MSCCGQGRRALARSTAQTSPASAGSPVPAQVTALAATPAAMANVIQLALAMARAKRRQSLPPQANSTSHQPARR